MKRSFDVVLSLLGLLLLSPLFMIIIPILRLTGEGEIFYEQARIGKGARKFNLLKFATMLKASPNLGSGFITQKNDPRVLPLGKFLRKTKINELPQIINILKGDMSIVGPRPQVEKHFLFYTPEIQSAIASIQPGLTGIGSIVFRDEEHILTHCETDPHAFFQQVIAPYKGILEVWYAQHASFWIDLKIIVLTMWVVLKPHSKWYRLWLPDLPRVPVELSPWL